MFRKASCKALTEKRNRWGLNGDHPIQTFPALMANGDRAKSPVLIAPRTTILSPAGSDADALDSFAAITETDPPVDWKFPDFYREVTSPDSA
jgi:hypothetical protein